MWNFFFSFRVVSGRPETKYTVLVDWDGGREDRVLTAACAMSLILPPGNTISLIFFSFLKAVRPLPLLVATMMSIIVLWIELRYNI